MNDRMFFHTPLGKIMGHGIHEHNSGLGLLSGVIHRMKREITADRLPKEDCLLQLENLEKWRTRCREAMDWIYKAIKEHHLVEEKAKKRYALEQQIVLLESLKENDTGQMSSMSEYVYNGIFDKKLDKRITELQKQLEELT